MDKLSFERLHKMEWMKMVNIIVKSGLLSECFKRMAVSTFVVLLACRSAHAAAALDLGSPGPFVVASQNTQTVGWEFIPNIDITIKKLGFFDSGQDGLAQSHAVAIWDSTGTLLVQTLVIAGTGAILDNQFRYVDVPDTGLVAGQHYIVGAQYFGGGADGFVLHMPPTHSFDPAITHVRDRYRLGFGLPFPDVLEPLGLPMYSDANFQFVPEPTTLALLALGATIIMRRRREDRATRADTCV